jgi:hypothetical protein
MTSPLEPLHILVAGPYRSGTSDDPVKIQANVDAMSDIALRLFRAGHLPVLGEWYALPLIEHAGSQQTGDEVFNEIFHPIARRLVSSHWRSISWCRRHGRGRQGTQETCFHALGRSPRVRLLRP